MILLDTAPFNMTHDLSVIGGQLPADFQTPVSTPDLAWLADLEVSARHPDDGDAIALDDAKRAVAMASSILDAVAGHFADRGVAEDEIDPE